MLCSLWGQQGAPCSATVPELVDPGQGGDGPVPDVAGVVDLAVLHLHLGIFQPEGDVPVVHIQGTLVNGTGSGKHEYRAGEMCLPDPGVCLKTLVRDACITVTSGSPSGFPPIVRTLSSY